MLSQLGGPRPSWLTSGANELEISAHGHGRIQARAAALIAVAFTELHWNAEAFCPEHLFPILLEIHKYLIVTIRRGELREIDAAMATAALTSMVLMHHQFSRRIVGGRPADLDSRKFARSYTRFWLAVLNPMSLAPLLPV